MTGGAGTPHRRELANAIRALAIDAVEQARSGHPGMPLGMADVAEVLWNDFLRHNPANPGWPNRDRFVLSNGHGSMLLYALLHLTGYDLPMEEIRRFRQLGSRTPGHPERGDTPGVETTTGPLGQGLANAVGMALGERVLGAGFNRPGFEVIDHRTWVFCGDGCLMEGISHEACSLAGTLGLGKLVAIYDDNGISIDGRVEGWFTDDTPARFEAYGWHVIRDVDGHDPEAIARALTLASEESERPTLVQCRTVIGYGSPHKAGTADVHGAPLGPEEARATREALGWEHPPFVIPEAIYRAWDARERGARAEGQWRELFEAYRRRHPALAGELERRLEGRLPASWEADTRRLVTDMAERGETMATRKASLRVLEALGPRLPELFGGSADLTGSNLTLWSGAHVVSARAPGPPPPAVDAAGDGDGDPGGDTAPGAVYLHYGVREFAMVAMANGLALHGGFIPYAGTFLVFSDYARSAIRMAALMRARVVLVLTHDSIGLGEDGPTHQPVEHASSLRLVPNLELWRPCDGAETAAAWAAAVERAEGPTALALSRQDLPAMERSSGQVEAIRQGAYVLWEGGGEPDGGSRAPDVILIGTGSEVALALEAGRRLAARAGAGEGRPPRVRVVSMPCAERFASAPAEYREQVLPAATRARVAVEAGSSGYWWRWVGEHGAVLGLDRFGLSAPARELFVHFGFTPERVLELAQACLARVREGAAP